MSSAVRPHLNPEKIKQLYQVVDGPAVAAEWSPFYCVEARIDFNDVRTGFRETVSLSRALEIYSGNADLLWTDDMIREIDLARTSMGAPEGAQAGALPPFVDANFLTRMENQFVQYLLRSFDVKIYRNFDLNIYSFSGESRDDFCRRCAELFENRKRSEFDKLHEVFIRKLEQAKQKYLGAPEAAELEMAKAESRNRDSFSRCFEGIAELFNSAEYGLTPAATEPVQPGLPELEERLLALQAEARQELLKTAKAFEERARSVDEYILHPNLKDIHFVRSCILWMPKELA